MFLEPESGKDYYLEFEGDIDWQSRTEIEARIRFAVLNNVSRIYFCMHSYGGSTQDAKKLSYFIQEVGTPVTTYNMGCVESAAATVYVAGEKRITHPAARFLLHPASFALDGNYTEDDLRTKVEVLSNDRRELVKLFSARTKLPLKLLKSAFGRRDYTFNSERALKYELAHEEAVLEIPKDAPHERLHYKRK